MLDYHFMPMMISGWGECCNKLVFHNSYAVEHLAWQYYPRTYVFSNLSIPYYLYLHEEPNYSRQWTVKTIYRFKIFHFKGYTNFGISNKYQNNFVLYNVDITRARK